MRKILKALAGTVMMALLAVPVAAQQPGLRTIEIGMLSTTHVLFASDLTYVDISSPNFILAKVVDASKNMLAIKAKAEFAFVTTISALEANGTMHTFYVRYNSTPTTLMIDTRVADHSVVADVNTQIRPDQVAGAPVFQGAQSAQGGGSSSATDQNAAAAAAAAATSNGRRGRTGSTPAPAASSNGSVVITGSQTSNSGRADAPTLDEVMQKDRQVFHVYDKVYHLEASVINVFAYSDVTYIVITLRNNSDIGYEAGDAQFTVENKKVSSRTLSTDKSVWAKSSYGTLSCAPNSSTMIGYTIPKLTLQSNEVLKIYIYEKGGTRNLFLTLDDKDVNYAVSPLDH